MAQNSVITVGPLFLTTTLTTNIFNCNVTSLAGPVGITLLQPYAIFNHIRIVNVTGLSATFTLYKGATGANVNGTQVIGAGLSVPGNGAFDEYGRWLFKAADFLVGGAGTVNALTLAMEGEIGFSQ